MLKKIFLLTFIMNSTFALMVLDIEITHEKVLGKKTILKSELMVSESVHNGKDVFLQMQNGIQVRMKPEYKQKHEEIEPDTAVEIRGVLQNISASKKAPKTFQVSAKIGTPSLIEFETGEGQKTKITITPKIK